MTKSNNPSDERDYPHELSVQVYGFIINWIAGKILSVDVITAFFEDRRYPRRFGLRVFEMNFSILRE